MKNTIHTSLIAISILTALAIILADISHASKLAGLVFTTAGSLIVFIGWQSMHSPHSWNSEVRSLPKTSHDADLPNLKKVA